MAFPLVPTTTTLQIPATFSPPTTCFPDITEPTYTLLPNGPDSQLSDRLIVRPVSTQCYPSGITDLGRVQTRTSIFDAGQHQRAGSAVRATHTAEYFAAGSCPQGFKSAGGGDGVDVTCCPSGPFTLFPIAVGVSSACVQTPNAVISVVDGTITTTLNTPTGTPFGVAYRPVVIQLTGSASPAPTMEAKSGRLSSGAQAGIGVGVALTFVLLAMLGLVISGLRRRRRREWSERRSAARSSRKVTSSTEIDGVEKQDYEFAVRERAEKDGDRMSGTTAAGVEAGGRGWEEPVGQDGMGGKS